MNDLLFTFYGDDFTGSTDALEVLATAGLRSVLFTEPPTAAMLSQYPGVQAVGLAGISRSLSPQEMEAELRPAFAALAALRPRHLHYKVCSTFDSSPEIGSIGKAIEIGSEISRATFVPLLVGNPRLGRYCVFGNLFAQVGVGHEGIVHRLDRHPTASMHPVTPMQESDLRLHLAKQTRKSIGLFDILNFALSKDEQHRRFRQLVESGAEVLLLDVLNPDHLAALGELIDRSATGAEPLFTVGSSGVEAALCAHWQATGKLAGIQAWPQPAPVDQILVVSGSCSPVTSAQIDWAVSHGFAELPLDSCVLTDEECNSSLLQVVPNLVNLINGGKSAVLHTGRKDANPMVSTARHAAGRNISSLDSSSLDSSSLVCEAWDSRRLGSALGRVIAKVIEQTGIKRVCIAGGDTASYATRQMGITALEMICPTTPGAPLCKAHAPGQPVDGIEICIKGGQVGKADYFGSLLQLK
jgi:3-oxoisoapionate kinase